MSLYGQEVAIDMDIEPFTNDVTLEFYGPGNGFALLGSSNC
jgi:hypothetical protein